MDPATSIITLVGTAAQVVGYIKDVKTGGQERVALGEEVGMIEQTLTKLQQRSTVSTAEANLKWDQMIAPLFESGGTIERLQATLDEVNAKLEAARGRSLKALIKKVWWPISKTDVQHLLERLRALRDNITLALTGSALRTTVESGIDSKITRDVVTAAEFQTVLSSISSTDYRSKLRSEQHISVSRTGQWFFDHPQVRGWCECRAKVLWCCGVPGAGKTILASGLCRKVDRRYEDDDDVAVTVLFCAFDDKNNQSAHSILSALLRQLVSRQHENSDAVKRLLQHRAKDTDLSGRANLRLLVEALCYELGKFSKTFVILDGLDELRSDDETTSLLKTLESLQPLPYLMVTSRPTKCIAAWFRCAAREGNYKIHDKGQEAEELPTSCDSCNAEDVSMSMPGTADHTSEIVPKPTLTAYSCVQCGRAVCITCFDRLIACSCCESPRECLTWTWPQSMTVAARPEDIENYIRWRVEQSRVLKFLASDAEQRNVDLIRKIQNKVQMESHDSFLLAKFHMNAIDEQATTQGVLQTLESLPNNINDVYRLAFERIGNSQMATILQKLLLIVATATFPLPAPALSQALAVQSGDRDVRMLNLSNVHDLASLCLGLVEIDPEGVVKLSHETVAFYISRFAFPGLKAGHVLLAETYITYLQFSIFTPVAHPTAYLAEAMYARINEYELFLPAVLQWVIHARESCSTDVHALAFGFLEHAQPRAVIAQFMWFYGLTGDANANTQYCWDVLDDVHGLHISAWFGILGTISKFISAGIDPDIEDCLQTTPLMWAAEGGHTKAFELLLQAGANPGLLCGRRRTALQRACFQCHTAVVKELVKYDGDIAVNAFDPYNGELTALMIAVSRNAIEIVELLLTRSDIDTSVVVCLNPFRNALAEAVILNNHEAVELLLEDGRVNVNSTDASGNTALSLTIGGFSMIKLLLDHGASPECLCQGFPIVQAATRRGHYGSAQLLINAGADCYRTDDRGRGILHALRIADDGGDLEDAGTYLRYLVNRFQELDLNLQDSHGDTPLHYAIYHEALPVGKALLELGARLEVQNNDGEAPLEVASRYGNESMVQLLLEALSKPGQSEKVAVDVEILPTKLPLHGAIHSLSPSELATYIQTSDSDLAEFINEQDKPRGRTALWVAVAHGLIDELRVLLQLGADANIADCRGHTPLHQAVASDVPEAVEVLLEQEGRVNLDIVNNEDMTPSAFAIRRHRSRCAIVFLEHGVRQDSLRDHMEHVLEHAAEIGNLAVVRVLVEIGVPILRQNMNINCPTACQLAMRNGHWNVCEYLFDQAERFSRGHATLPVLSVSTYDDDGGHIILDVADEEIGATLAYTELEERSNTECEDPTCEQESHRYGLDHSITNPDGVICENDEAVVGHDAPTAAIVPRHVFVWRMFERYGILGLTMTRREVFMLSLLVVLAALFLVRS